MNVSTFSALPEAVMAILFSFLAVEPVPRDDGSGSAKPLAISSFEEVLKEIGTNDRFWTAPYVLADLEEPAVYVWSEHTGMIPGDPVEFFAISEDSGHRYEALVVSFARPSDIHQALEKTGLSPGGPVNSDVHHFWPKGDRVAASVLYRKEKDQPPVEEPVESFISWKGDPMPLMPWVFTGAPMMPSLDDEEKTVYAADQFGPNSIASTFNLRATVFDLPMQGSKTGTYGDFLLLPSLEMEEGLPMLLKLQPAPASSYPAEVDLHLNLQPDGIQAEGYPGLDPADLADVGAFLSDRQNEVQFLTLDFSDEMTLTEATARAREVQLLETHIESIRVEPPPTGQVFFQSFVPDPRFRVRENRPSQPLELHIESEVAVVKELEEVWGETRVPEVIELKKPMATPQDWHHYVNEHLDGSGVLFVYADPELTLQEMRKWTGPVLDHFPIVFIYKNQE